MVLIPAVIKNGLQVLQSVVSQVQRRGKLGSNFVRTFLGALLRLYRNGHHLSEVSGSRSNPSPMSRAEESTTLMPIANCRRLMVLNYKCIMEELGCSVQASR